MSQMPDKIWLHKDTKYNTTDEVFGYQYEFAQEIQDEGIENFVEYIPFNAFIEKAVKHIDGLIEFLNEFGHQLKKERIIEDFKKYMKEE